MGSDRLVALGVFGAPQGVRGELRIKSYTAVPRDVGAYGALTDAAGRRRFALQSVRALKDDMVVARVEGVADRDAAAALSGVELFARRSQLPPPGADEFYHDDLIGLEAVTPQGVSLGRVVAVSNHGAGDILEIEDAGELRLLPFTKAIAPDIDFAAGRITTIPPIEIGDETDPHG